MLFLIKNDQGFSPITQRNMTASAMRATLSPTENHPGCFI